LEELTRFAEIACEAARKAGAEFADASCHRGRNVSVDIEKNSIKSCDVRWSQGISVRAIYRGGSGSASSDKLDERAAVEAGRNAAELAKLSEPDPDFVTLPPPEPCTEVPGLYDERVAALGIKDLIGIILAEVDAARSVARDANVQAGIGCSDWQSALANSLGIRHFQAGSSIGCSVTPIIRRGDDVGTFFDFDQARAMEDFDPTGIGARAAEMALRFLGARKIETAVMPIVLGPLASPTLAYALAGAADAEDVQRNRSFLVDMEGRQIASEILTLVDDPTIPRGMGSRACDGEGVPSRKLTFVENGVLCTYFYNSYTANKAKRPYTGTGYRSGAGPSNLIPKLGEKTSQQIISEIESGLYINMGGISPNPITGEVSGSVDFGFKIERGELAYPVKNTMIAGNFLEMLGNLDAISSDYRAEPGRIMPTVRIQGVRVAGGK